MKKLACVIVVAAALGSTGAAMITQFEALVGAALTTLKFESIPPQAGVVGAPPQFKVTKATIQYMHKLEHDGKVIEVQGNGTIVIK